MVFGTKRDTKADSGLREDVVGNLYPDSFPDEGAEMTPNPMEFRRPDPGNESVIDPHARFNGKYVSDRDLRIEGEASGEIECSGTLIISPQAKVRSSITAANVIINGDYEGDVDCGGRFEIGSTGGSRARSRPRSWSSRKARTSRAAVIMTPEGRASSNAPPPPAAQRPPRRAAAAARPRSRGGCRAARGASSTRSARSSRAERAATGTGQQLLTR